jgi:hypothetical protein
MTVPKEPSPETEGEEPDELADVQGEIEPKKGTFSDSVKGPGQGPTGKL